MRDMRVNMFEIKYNKSTSATVIKMWSFLTAFVLVLSTTTADRTFTKVYEPIVGTAACFKRLNGTHEIGCRSSSSGEVGVLHLIDDQQSLQWVLKDGPHSPYIAIVYPEYFTKDNVMQFKNSKRVAGILLLKESSITTVASFSTDSTCPNEGFSFYNASSPQYCPKWNSPGNNLLLENLDFPIFHVHNETEKETVLNCFKNFNKPVNQTARDWPLCAAQLKAFMLAAVDTPTCLRRSQAISFSPGAAKVCDPLGDQNVWGSLFPTNHSNPEPYPDNSVIVIGARLDGASLFDEISPSADSSITALVTLLTIVKQLSAVQELSASSAKNVYFMLFNGEAFDYIGSSRIVYDMQNNNFPITLNQIKYFIEINQAASVNDESYYIHQSDLSQSKELTDILTEKSKKSNLPLAVVPKSNWGVPPSSLHSFLKGNPNITGIVITNHKEGYRNKFYNSIFDVKENINYTYSDQSLFSIQQKIARLAATVANTVIELIDPGKKNLDPDVENVDELLHCYLDTANCSIFQAIYGASGNSDPLATYVGVSNYLGTFSQTTKMLMISYLGKVVENITSEGDCWKTPMQYWFNSTCWSASQVNATEARSPAFLTEDYDWSSGKYSTWTESVWQKLSVRIFVKPSLFHEIMTLVSGVLVAIVGFIVVRAVNSKADIIFESRYTGYIPVPPD